MSKKTPLILTVVAAWNLTPNMIRVTLATPAIGKMDPGCQGANCKLFLPEKGQGLDSFTRQLEEGPRPVVRTYTVRGIRPEQGQMDIDFVDHGRHGNGEGATATATATATEEAGPASAWARAAKPGAFCGFTGPGQVKLTSFHADRYLIVADMSALPLAAATLEVMPDDAKGTAIFELTSREDRQNFRIPEGIECHWILNPHPHVANTHIIQMVKDMDWLTVDGPEGSIQTCIAGESSMVKALRQELLVKRGLPKDDCYISGYWKIGLIEDEHQKMKRAEAG